LCPSLILTKERRSERERERSGVRYGVKEKRERWGSTVSVSYLGYDYPFYVLSLFADLRASMAGRSGMR